MKNNIKNKLKEYKHKQILLDEIKQEIINKMKASTAEQVNRLMGVIKERRINLRNDGDIELKHGYLTWFIVYSNKTLAYPQKANKLICEYLDIEYIEE